MAAKTKPTPDEEERREARQRRREQLQARRAALAEKREARWLRFKRQLEADVMLDPRLLELFSDRTIWSVAEQMEFLGITNYRMITKFSQNRRIFRSRNSWFSAVLPDPDEYLGTGFTRPRPGIEAGRLRFWAWADHRMIWNSRAGELQINPHWRAGNKKSLPKPRFRYRGKKTEEAEIKTRGANRRNEPDTGS